MIEHYTHGSWQPTHLVFVESRTVDVGQVLTQVIRLGTYKFDPFLKQVMHKVVKFWQV